MFVVDALKAIVLHMQKSGHREGSKSGKCPGNFMGPAAQIDTLDVNKYFLLLFTFLDLQLLFQP